ncbi:hypothetical protein N9L68_01885, partial [bacterium]|nr:hypothetical protein [bacterium]
EVADLEEALNATKAALRGLVNEENYEVAAIRGTGEMLQWLEENLADEPLQTKLAQAKAVANEQQRLAAEATEPNTPTVEEVKDGEHGEEHDWLADEPDPKAAHVTLGGTRNSRASGTG